MGVYSVSLLDAVLLAVALLLVAGGTVWLSRDLSRGRKTVFRLLIAGLMAVLLLPQSLFVELARSGSSVLPWIGVVLGHPAADHVFHFLVFVLAGLPVAALSRRHDWRGVLAWLVALAIGLEALQLLVGGHQATILDGLANLAGAAVGYGIGVAVGSMRKSSGS